MKSSKKSKTTKNYTKKIGGNNNKQQNKAVSFNPVTRANNGTVNKLKPSAGNQLNTNQHHQQMLLIKHQKQILINHHQQMLLIKHQKQILINHHQQMLLIKHHRSRK